LPSAARLKKPAEGVAIHGGLFPWRQLLPPGCITVIWVSSLNSLS
jgi:hypothetical protein